MSGLVLHKRRLKWDVCNKLHPGVLHIQFKEKTTSPGTEQSPPDGDKNTSHVTCQSCSHIGAGNNDSTLSIVPVQIKSYKSDKIIETYAFLDPGSTASFCTTQLMSNLNIKGRKTNIMLRTMSQEKNVTSHLVTGLEISGLDESDFIALPEVYTQKEMPVTKDNIIRKKDLSKWSYLNNVHIPVINAEVGLLIGTDAPKVIEPLEVINSKGDGPFAVRTRLGWIVNGPLGRHDGTEIACHQTVQCNRSSIAKVEQLLISQHNQDFSEKASEDKPEMSMEDRKFMTCANSSVTLKDGHYYLDLPFRRNVLVMPNNGSVAEQRLLGLKRKLEKNEHFKKEYINFMADVTEKGYAEVVPSEQLEKTDGRVWYIPHHGVYHPKKQTLRVVFDCSASYQGKSLNSELLQGPDLTNSLIGVLLRFRKEPVAVMTDIRSMFYRVRVSANDIDFLMVMSVKAQSNIACWFTYSELLHHPAAQPLL